MTAPLGWDPDRCACRWGEQPCFLCLPVLDARLRERRWERQMGPTIDAIKAAR